MVCEIVSIILAHRDDNKDDSNMEEKRIQCIFKSESGETEGSPFELPVDITRDKLQLICDAVIKNVSGY